jgi:hypothetical protein
MLPIGQNVWCIMAQRDTEMLFSTMQNSLTRSLLRFYQIPENKLDL